MFKFRCIPTEKYLGDSNALGSGLSTETSSQMVNFNRPALRTDYESDNNDKIEASAGSPGPLEVNLLRTDYESDNNDKIEASAGSPGPLELSFQPQSCAVFCLFRGFGAVSACACLASVFAQMATRVDRTSESEPFLDSFVVDTYETDLYVEVRTVGGT
ncbi:hypothetical protein QE152_g8227 [Popillia japonica]|uniref:Uncharacterized protein n=1 Tax=Popillia japonica TaxID=7064 RepID=A0AAW1MCI9_POPJA